jgi:GPI mannosyltransferase 3
MKYFRNAVDMCRNQLIIKLSSSGTIDSRLQSHQNKISEKRRWWNRLHLIAIIGLVIRLILALNFDTIYHPDEIFQYVEQAHRWEYGYGNIPWEYRHGIRSWILPGFITGLLHLLRILHIEDPNIYTPVIKAFFCVFSISIIYSTYIITRNIASEKAARLASVIACFWHELIFFASKAMPEVLSTYLIAIAIACLVTKSQTRNSLLFGVSCGLVAILRYQYLSIVVTLFILAAFKWNKIQILLVSVIVIMAVIGAGYVDYLTWGSFFASYYNNYLYNSIYKISEIFGIEPFSYYLTGGASIVTISSYFLIPKNNKPWIIFILILSIVIPHSLIAHKEFRFIFAVVPLCIILVSIIISSGFKPDQLIAPITIFLIEKISIKSLNTLKACKLIMWKLFSFLPAFLTFLLITGVLNIPKFQSTLSAYLFLHKEPNLFAIFNNYSGWGNTGAYYYLHRNVPIYYTDEFEDFGLEYYTPYVSHIICHKNQQAIPDFVTIFRDGDLEIRKNIIPNKKYQKLDIDTINFPQRGVDGLYQPTVKPHLK